MKKQAVNNTLLSEKLQEAFLSSLGNAHASQLINHVEILINQNDAIEYPSSLDRWFDDYINQLGESSIISNNKKSRLIIARRIAIVIICFAIGTTMLSLNSEAFRLRLFSLFVKSTEQFSEVTYDDSIIRVTLEDDMPADWSNYYFPTLIPIGYTLSNVLDAGDDKYIIFTNKEKLDLVFIQSALNATVLVDSENALSYEVDINGIQGTIFEKTELTTLLWADNANSFYLIGNVDKNTLVKIASTMQYEK